MKENNTKSIGIFDSGFGGLTVMRAICALMPQENILYFADTARLPYGSKSQQTILRYTLENALFLEKQGIKALVIACNTASAASLEQVREALHIPVIGITEQGVEEVVRHITEGKIGILGTKATISSGIYEKNIRKHRENIQFFSICCPLFVPLVEEGYSEHPMSALVAEEYLRPLKKEALQAVLLGCTHYPLLKSVIEKELGKNVKLIDPATSCAKQTQALLLENNLLNLGTQTPSYEFIVSDDPEKFRLLGQTFLGQPIGPVTLA